MLASIDASTADSGEKTTGEKPGLFIPSGRAFNLYQMLNNNGTSAKAPELLRKARAEIHRERLEFPLNVDAYAAYAYLMAHFRTFRQKSGQIT